MFGKAKTSKRLETIIGEGTEVNGALNVKGTLRVDGAVDGDIRADSLIVGESGRIRGNVKGRGVVVGGEVEGNIDAEEIVELKPKARVTGEIRSGKLSVSEGAVFDGQCRMGAGAETAAESDTRIISFTPPATLT